MSLNRGYCYIGNVADAPWLIPLLAKVGKDF
jgi:hypothetical protein